LAYHNHTYDYYNRDISHPNLGYDYKGLGNGLEMRKTWPSSDLEMMEVTTDEYMNDEPFHSYYMTVSGHMRYNWGGNFIASKNKDLVQELPYLEAGKAYMATQIELDKALEHLMNKLEEAGVADRTLIVMSSDHYPYGLELNEISDLAGHEVESNFELYRNSLILYAKGMEPETIDRPVSSLDIIPTISNLLGLEFDSRLLMGVDAFSDNDPIVIFNNRSFITDKGRYNSLTKTFTLNEGVEMSQEEMDTYRKTISDEIERQFYYSAMILDTDYFSTVIDR
ncbi:MAG TPA: sulfatase-like hydrolase/transferase, partial [Bacteroidales bacterium]|nr:sulfatase-like hydrolase/transferase [Bacteroidales bacterium]